MFTRNVCCMCASVCRKELTPWIQVIVFIFRLVIASNVKNGSITALFTKPPAPLQPAIRKKLLAGVPS